MLVLASATGVSAQSAPERRNPSPASQAATQQPAQPVAQVADSAAAALPSTPAPVRLQFPNSDLVDVLHLYEQLTGKKLVMDNFV